MMFFCKHGAMLSCHDRVERGPVRDPGPRPQTHRRRRPVVVVSEHNRWSGLQVFFFRDFDDRNFPAFSTASHNIHAASFEQNYCMTATSGSSDMTA